MIFSPTEDQAMIVDALARLTARHATIDMNNAVKRTVYSRELEAELAESGFLDVGVGDRDAAVTSALIVGELAKLPVAVEATGTALVRPTAFPDRPGPVALIHGDPARPTRFLPVARTACILTEDAVRLLELQPGDVTEVESIFAYPMGCLAPAALERAERLDATRREAIEAWWRIGAALEIHGALDSAMRITCEHVSERNQFGRPIGSFQAVQHRLAMSATAVEACRWLALVAASSGKPADAAAALAYAQGAARSVTYDTHQFSGAMGLTLEYPLHLFSYRARCLQAELGNSTEHYAAVADRLWPKSRTAQGELARSMEMAG